MFAVAIKQNGHTTAFRIKDSEDQTISYETLRKLLDKINVGYFEVVKFSIDKNDYFLLVDEEGLMKENMYFNIAAAALCGKTIVGNALVLADRDDEEMYAFNDKELHAFLERREWV